MKPEDVAVWDRFIDTNPAFFDSVDYNYPLGEGVDVGEDEPETQRRGFQILTQKKVDVVGYRADGVTIVEVKPIADMRGLGQALSYSHLFALAHPEAVPLSRMVVAGEMERDLEAVYAAQGVLFEQA
ncbi:MAG: hypothetical protein EPO20_30845 [Betaproteobacteria bacterium]|nr:MAG: hypothetical protein EPO20_30845 [Betaproteobacteria bacterium]